jgi:hypothetical protein
MQAMEQTYEFSPDVGPLFDRTLLGSVRKPVDPARWDAVIDRYETGRYREAVIGILDYLDSELVAKRGNSSRTEFVIPHGSIVVRIKLDDSHFTVTAPFLEIPGERIVPLLRQVAEINLVLSLPYIALEDRHLIFKFSCPLDLCEPFKVYDVLREMCVYADDYDDEFIKKFGAKHIYQPVIRRFPPKYTDYAWQRVQLYLKEAVDYIDYFEKRRMYEYCLDIIFITLARIDYYTVPQGVLRTDIEKNLGYLHNQELDLMDKVRKGSASLKQLREYNRADFIKDLYVAETFIPMKYNFSGEMIERVFEGTYKIAKEEMGSRNYLAAALTLQHAYMNLFFQYIVAEDIKEIITGALLKASRQPWDSGASTLWNALQEVMGHKKSRRKKSFWGSLFGRN